MIQRDVVPELNMIRDPILSVLNLTMEMIARELECAHGKRANMLTVSHQLNHHRRQCHQHRPHLERDVVMVMHRITCSVTAWMLEDVHLPPIASGLKLMIPKNVY